MGASYFFCPWKRGAQETGGVKNRKEKKQNCDTSGEGETSVANKLDGPTIAIITEAAQQQVLRWDKES